MSGCGWVTTLLWLSGSLRHFSYSSSVNSCHLFLISSASVRFRLSLYFIVRIFAWNILLVALIFLKRSLVFLILSFSSISLHCSLNHNIAWISWPSISQWSVTVIMTFLMKECDMYFFPPQNVRAHRHQKSNFLNIFVGSHIPISLRRGGGRWRGVRGKINF